jgi:inner membrane protein
MEELKKDLEKCKNKDKTIHKLLVIIVFLLLLLIPLGFVENTIQQRAEYKKEATQKVTKAWAKTQTISLPQIKILKEKFITKIDEKTKRQIKEKILKEIYLPIEDLTTNIEIDTEIRKKGIFKVPVYTSLINTKGVFKNLDYTSINGTLSFNVEDSRGFISEPSYTLNGKKLNCENNLCKINLKNPPKFIPFEINYKLRGSNFIKLRVGGKTNKIKISGNWADPSFEGDFLPAKRKVTNDNFDATWEIPQIATKNIDNPLCGVSLLTPVDNYRMTIRTVKYGFLFLALTFLAFFVFEITSKNTPLHPFQYGLIGISMIIFYLLLVSISEFLPFYLAYTIATTMTVSLITGYTHFVLTKKENSKFSKLIAGILILLYTYLYTILNLQDFSLLLGSLGIFLAIILVMYATRNINWYNENER